VKLYWRYKKNGKWTWQPVERLSLGQIAEYAGRPDFVDLILEEEE
jgi:hypothetical protein